MFFFVRVISTTVTHSSTWKFVSWCIAKLIDHCEKILVTSLILVSLGNISITGVCVFVFTEWFESTGISVRVFLYGRVMFEYIQSTISMYCFLFSFCSTMQSSAIPSLIWSLCNGLLLEKTYDLMRWCYRQVAHSNIKIVGKNGNTFWRFRLILCVISMFFLVTYGLPEYECVIVEGRKIKNEKRKQRMNVAELWVVRRRGRLRVECTCVLTCCCFCQLNACVSEHICGRCLTFSSPLYLFITHRITTLQLLTSSCFFVQMISTGLF